MGGFAGKGAAMMPPPRYKRMDNEDLVSESIAKRWGTDSSFDHLQAVNRWDNTMARKTYRIELKIDFNDDSRHDTMKMVATQFARDFLGASMLLQDGRKPDIAIICDDAFVGREEIELLPQNVTHE